MSRKSKVKWTQQMNTDVLECKRKAQELVTSGNASQPLTMHIMRPQNGGKILSRRSCAISVKTMAGGCPASNWWRHGTARRETSKSTGSPFGSFAFRASRRCPRLNLPTDRWGNGTGCGSANKRFWGSLRRSCEWASANSCIRVIQEIWNRPVRSNSRNNPTLVHWIYRSPWYWGNFSESTHPPGQRTALHNIRVLSPTLATYVINTYSQPERL